ncbi:MAG TPA: dTDP-4-dehydrorhamnose 3,5-epimerase [Waddliaceae bacterium]
MKFTPTPLKRAFLIDLEKTEDSRGFFARLYCCEEFKQHALEPKIVQANDSWSASKGTLRGLHYQLPPKSETKLVRCLSGSLYDMILDIRKDSPTFGKSFGAVLSAENRRMMYVPHGFAHGFLTLEDNTEIFYLVSEFFSKELERGIRWDDPCFNLAWPETPKIISDRDRNHPNFNPEHHLKVQ